MKKRIKKISGTSYGIIITKEDMELWDLKEGSTLNVTFPGEINWIELNHRVDKEIETEVKNDSDL